MLAARASPAMGIEFREDRAMEAPRQQAGLLAGNDGASHRSRPSSEKGGSCRAG